jgi:Holliday junction resolvase
VTGGRGPKNKGDAHERNVVKYFQSRGFQVERAKRGNATGDILGITGVVVEAKDQRTFALGSWVDQMLAEVEEAGARTGVVIAKRPRTTNVAEHYAILTVEDYLTLLEEAGYG